MIKKLKVTKKNDDDILILNNDKDIRDIKFKMTGKNPISFVDGGITDNIGLRAQYDILELIGGPKIFMEKTHQTLSNKMVVIMVDASTTPVYGMDKSNKQPSMAEAMDEHKR